MTRWVERYRDGEHVQVWTEMTSLGADARAYDSWDEAVEVTRETMRRARRNVDRLLELLPARGYVFEPGALPVFEPPAPDVAAALDHVEQRVGSLPLAFRCWLEEVGLVNFVGRHPAWKFQYTDPLVVTAPPEYILSQYDEWKADPDAMSGFQIDIAPDFLHKANVSGGAYSLAVPDAGVDGLLRGERHQTTFVNYLRICFRWGAFPGWDAGVTEARAKPPSEPPALLAELAGSLLPL